MARSATPQLDELITGLRVLLRDGLPVRVLQRPTALFKLRSVRARAGSTSLLDRAAALDWLLCQIMRTFGDGPDGQAAQTLFALAPGTRGLNLTKRREEAARLRGKSYDHWRKHLEPALLRDIAQELHQRELLYRPHVEDVAPFTESPMLKPPDSPAEVGALRRCTSS